jgi:hypothetical protein
MQIYSINTKGEFKPKRTINIDDYYIYDCGGSSGIEIKHKKNGRKLFLATKELFEHCMFEYEKQKPSIGVTYSYIKDEHGNKLRDEKGKPLKKYTSKEEIEKYKKVALKYSYIEYDDFFNLLEEYRKET